MELLDKLQTLLVGIPWVRRLSAFVWHLAGILATYALAFALRFDFTANETVYIIYVAIDLK